MALYHVNFRFLGGQADQHRLDAWDGKEFHEGARRFLALNAHFFVHNDVPNGGAINRTQYYRVYEQAAKEGSICLPYAVELFPGVAEHFVYGAAMAAGKWTFDKFLRESLESILTRKEAPPELWDRIEPVFTDVSGNRSPIVDIDPELEEKWDELRGKGASAATTMFFPIGRSAERCVVEIGALEPIVIERTTAAKIKLLSQQHKELQITEAVHRLRTTHRRAS